MKPLTHVVSATARGFAAATCRCARLLPIFAAALALLIFGLIGPREPDALYLAASRDDFSRFAELAARVSDLNAPDHLGYTPLAVAAGFGRRESVEMLLSRGAAADAGHPLLGTPLMLALTNGHADVARVLLARGADVNVRCGGFDPLACAVRSNDLTCLELVLGAGADVHGPAARRCCLLTLAQQDEANVHVLRRLLELGVDPNEADADGGAPLLDAVGSRATCAVRLLLAAGADPDRAGPDGRTPRELAQGSEEMRRIFAEDRR